MGESGPLPEFFYKSSAITKASLLDTSIVQNSFLMKINPAQATFSMHSLLMTYREKNAALYELTCKKSIVLPNWFLSLLWKIPSF